MQSTFKKLGLIKMCGGGRCPRIFKDTNGDYIIQGIKVSDEIKTSLNPLENEDIVKLPKSLIDELRENW